MKHTTRILVSSLFLIGLAASSALANGSKAPPPPPPEALAACEGAGRGDACRFTAPDGHEVTGTCRSPSDELPLACAPECPRP